MRGLTQSFCCVSIFIIISCVLLLPSLSDNAWAQGECDIGICKIAEGAGGIEFPFTTDRGGEIGGFSLVDGGLCVLLTFDSLEVVEDFVPGWQLDHVECETIVGITVTEIDGGIDLECVGPNGGGGRCDFVNVPGVNANIPTLSEWGMIAAAAGLALIGVFFAVRRKRMQDA